jgi:predicted small lipoprotein YifL
MKFYLTLVIAGLLALTGCDNDGPAEEVGENIDEAVQDAGNAVEDTCEDVTGDNC